MEIEIKATFENKQKLVNKLNKLGAEREKNKHQMDEYYNHPSIDTRKTNEYIRLRYNSGKNNGIFAHHINIADGVNKEFEVPVEDVKTFKKILENLEFPILGIIDKKRETFKLGEFTITIDEVKDIGNFVEIETEGEQTDVKEKKSSCVNMLSKLGLSEKNLTNKIWLCDIATGRTKYPPGGDVDKEM